MPTRNGGHRLSAGEAVRKRFPNVNREEIEAASDDVNSMVELLVRKTGEAKEQVEGFVRDLYEGGAAQVQHAATAVADYAQQAGETMSQTYDDALDMARQRYEQAEGYIQDRPTQSVAAAFCLGIAAGVVATLALSPRR